MAWAREAVERGAGEIMLTSMDRDGTNAGYDLELTRAVCARGQRPGHRLGRRGELDHLADALEAGADAALVASLFHFGHFSVGEAKEHLARRGQPVRVTAPHDVHALGRGYRAGTSRGRPREVELARRRGGRDRRAQDHLGHRGGGRKVRASKDEPQYLVKSEKSGGTAPQDAAAKLREGLTLKLGTGI